jgi:hypothetical protein
VFFYGFDLIITKTFKKYHFKVFQLKNIF